MIRINNVTKVFNPGSVNEVKALENINLNVQDGDFVTVIGTNGSGKSTLLNLIAGNISPDSGTIEIDGTDVTRQKEYERARYISRVFQNPFSGTAPGMTIAENLLMAYFRGKTRTARISLNKKMLEHFRSEVAKLEMQLDDRLENVIGTLSGGQRQALTLLMAVIEKPKVLLLDEHTAALDPKTASQVISLTKKFIDDGKLTTIMITHSMQQALELGNKTVMMYRGRIIEEISAKEKMRLTPDDLLEKFADLRKKEKLTDELLEQLRNEYA